MKNHQQLLEIPSAWKGLEHFAVWLVDQLRPRVIVDLGVDHGFSSCALATPGYGTVYGVDNRIVELDFAKANAAKLGLTNVVFICDDFQVLAKEWRLPIDILHIDGNHSYESARKDFDTWVPHVRPGGVILMHDLEAFPDGPGVVFNETPWVKWSVKEYCGLGVITKPYA